MERLTECVGYHNGKPIYKTKIDMRKMGSVDKLKEALGAYEDAEENGELVRISKEDGASPIQQFLEQVYHCKIGQRVYELFRFLGEGSWEVDEHVLNLEDLGKLESTVFVSEEVAKAEANRRNKENNDELMAESEREV